MARCMANEKLGKPVFYGSMVAEGFIGLVWATVGMSFYHGPEALAAALAAGGPGNVVTESSFALMGTVGGILAILGVVVLPITSGDTDTAFRSARLIVADFMGVEQRTLRKRIYICIPLFALGLLIIFGLPFQTMWSYFAWMNQTLAAVTLWMIVAYLRHRGRAVWVGLIPALVMTYVCASYIFVSPLMLGIS